MGEHATASGAIDQVLDRQAEFRGFLISRLGSEADADDVLQNALVKALRNAENVRDEEKVTAWFYQILRNAIVDHIRTRQSRAIREDSWAKESTAAHDEEAEKLACRCVDSLINELKPQEAELLRRIELRDEAVADAAKATNISANNASVTLHRARKKLRQRLEDFCGECSAGACLSCDCSSESDPNSK